MILKTSRRQLRLNCLLKQRVIRVFHQTEPFSREMRTAKSLDQTPDGSHGQDLAVRGSIATTLRSAFMACSAAFEYRDRPSA